MEDRDRKRPAMRISGIRETKGTHMGKGRETFRPKSTVTDAIPAAIKGRRNPRMAR
jgi:hypothetical protein